MSKVNFRTPELGIIEHKNGEFEVVKHIQMCETKEEARDKIDELYEEQ